MRVSLDFFELREHTGVVQGELLSRKYHLREVSGNYGDSVLLQQFLAGAAGVESEGTGTYLAYTAVAQSVHHAAHAGKLHEILLQEVGID